MARGKTSSVKSALLSLLLVRKEEWECPLGTSAYENKAYATNEALELIDDEVSSFSNEGFIFF